MTPDLSDSEDLLLRVESPLTDGAMTARGPVVDPYHLNNDIAWICTAADAAVPADYTINSFYTMH